jgi:hypothetical protein
MDKLLKEAIADAKAVRETALANAKLALEEAFAPKLQSMLSAKLNEEDDEMEDEDEMTDEGTGMGTDYLGEKGEEEMPEEEPTEEAAEMDDEESTEEALDLEAIIRELEMEAKGDEGEEEMTPEAAEEPKEETDEEINLDELLAALSEAGDEDEDDMKTEAKDEEEEKVEELMTQLAEYRETVVFLKNKINEINLLNAKLLYTNKLFRSFPLTESQKVKILESLDRTKSVREVKLVYSTLTESLNEVSAKTKTKISESLGFASKKSGATKKPILEEGSSLASRFQTLANINLKK